MIRVDLHTHSTASDGTRSPEELVRVGVQAGISVLAITDHDTLDGITEGLKAAGESDIRMIPGIELSVDLEEGGLSAHLLGYFPGADLEELLSGSTPLGAAIEYVQGGRARRNPKILEKLRNEGIHLDPEMIVRIAGGTVIGRPHIAKAMVMGGFVNDSNEAFSRFLAKGRSAYVERDRLQVKEAINLIAGAGGLPVLAHPAYIPMEPDELQRFFRRLSNYGLRGIEAYYPSHSRIMTKLLEEIGRSNDLVLTGGTDYHGLRQDETPLGGSENGFHVTMEMVIDFIALCDSCVKRR